MMNTRELIAELQKHDPNKEVLVNVRTQTQRYGQAQVTPWQVDGSYGATTIQVTLPEGAYIAKRSVA